MIVTAPVVSNNHRPWQAIATRVYVDYGSRRRVNRQIVLWTFERAHAHVEHSKHILWQISVKKNLAYGLWNRLRSEILRVFSVPDWAISIKRVGLGWVARVIKSTFFTNFFVMSYISLWKPKKKLCTWDICHHLRICDVQGNVYHSTCVIVPLLCKSSLGGLLLNLESCWKQHAIIVKSFSFCSSRQTPLVT